MNLKEMIVQFYGSGNTFNFNLACLNINWMFNSSSFLDSLCFLLTALTLLLS